MEGLYEFLFRGSPTDSKSGTPFLKSYLKSLKSLNFWNLKSKKVRELLVNFCIFMVLLMLKRGGGQLGSRFWRFIEDLCPFFCSSLVILCVKCKFLVVKSYEKSVKSLEKTQRFRNPYTFFWSWWPPDVRSMHMV